MAKVILQTSGRGTGYMIFYDFTQQIINQNKVTTIKIERERVARKIGLLSTNAYNMEI
jgi:hypothetical protein